MQIVAATPPQAVRQVARKLVAGRPNLTTERTPPHARGCWLLIIGQEISCSTRASRLASKLDLARNNADEHKTT